MLLLTSPTCSSCPLLELQQLLLIDQREDDFALAPRLLQHKVEEFTSTALHLHDCALPKNCCLSL